MSETTQKKTANGAATEYSVDIFITNKHVVNQRTAEFIKNAFKDGAQWKDKQYKELASLAALAAEKLKDGHADGLSKMISEQLDSLKNQSK